MFTITYRSGSGVSTSPSPVSVSTPQAKPAPPIAPPSRGSFLLARCGYTYYIVFVYIVFMLVGVAQLLVFPLKLQYELQTLRKIGKLYRNYDCNKSFALEGRTNLPTIKILILCVYKNGYYLRLISPQCLIYISESMLRTREFNVLLNLLENVRIF